jgi:hemolysin activation/secretion protein
MLNLRGFGNCLAVVLLFGSAFETTGQEQSPAARLEEEERRQIEQRRLEEGQENLTISTLEVKGPVAEAPCFDIHTIHLQGVSVFPIERFEGALTEYSSGCLGQISIGNLLERLTAIYAEAGYITTRAYVPAQDVSGGVLTIEILEGRIEAYVYGQIKNGGEPEPGPARKIDTALPQKSGEVFNLRDLEQGLENINRLASSQANANLSGGETPGTSKVEIIEQKADVVRATVGINNRGDDTSDVGQVRLRLEVDDVFRVNDAWVLSYSGTEHTNALAMFASAPYRKWLLSLSATYSEELAPITPVSDLFTQTASAAFTAQRLLFRNDRTKQYAYAELSSYWNERFVNIAPLTPQHRTTLRLGTRREHRAPNTVFTVDAAVAIGLGLFGSDRDLPDVSGTTPRSEFVAMSLRSNYIRPVGETWQLSALGSAQIANAPLHSNEQISLGGWDSVRGYEGFSFSGDSGLLARVEISPQQHEFSVNGFGQGRLRSFGFSDFGHVYSRARDRSKTMLSVGLGLSLQIANSTINGTLAVPLMSTNGQQSGDVQIFVGITQKVF